MDVNGTGFLVLIDYVTADPSSRMKCLCVTHFVIDYSFCQRIIAVFCHSDLQVSVMHFAAFRHEEEVANGKEEEK